MSLLPPTWKAASAGIPLPDVAAVINRVPAPLVVAKALFIYRRRYADVACSDMAKFGARNGVYNLRPIAAGDPHNWRSEGASRPALFWYARNQLRAVQDRAHVLQSPAFYAAAIDDGASLRVV